LLTVYAKVKLLDLTKARQLEFARVLKMVAIPYLTKLESI